MAIVNMTRLSLVAHSSEKSRLLRIFLKSGCVEIVKSENILLTSSFDDSQRRNQLDSKRMKIAFALNFLNDIVKENKNIEKKNAPSINLKKENRLVDLDEYYSVPKHEIDIFATISEMEQINSKLVDIKSEKAKNNALLEQLFVYKDVDIPFDQIKDSKMTSMFLGVMPTVRTPTALEEIKDLACVSDYGVDKLTAMVVICHKDNLGKVNEILSANDFVRASFAYDVTAGAKINDLQKENVNLDKSKDECIKKCLEYLSNVSQFKVAYDYYLLEIAKLDCMNSCPQSGKAFTLEAWLPTPRVEEIKENIVSKCKYAEVEFRQPFENENPPTLTKNNKIIAPFEGITDMFGVPNYRESDPNFFVAMFYFIFFGIMIGDAGYGLIMAIACFLFIKIVKPVKNSGRMVIMFGFCGISTIIWGALFGGWFGIDWEILKGTFLGKIAWFNPMEEPLKMFMLALGMGVFQIGTGFALKGISEIKQGYVVRGLLNNFSWVVIFIGLILLSPSLMVFLGAIELDVVPAIYGILAKAGLYTALVGFILMLVGGAVGKKNPVKMVGGALGNAYGAINVVSDLLSYSRLFGLGLTTGVIGYVINMLADIIVTTFFHGLWIGWIPAAIILVIGHTFNLAINLLGAYVHNSRLQYIEFFGRFYEGNGHELNPIGSKTKYTYLDN